MQNYACFVVGLLCILNQALTNADKNQIDELRQILSSIYDGKDFEIVDYNLTQIWTPFTPERNVSRIHLKLKIDGHTKNENAVIDGYPATDFGNNLVTENGFVANQKNFYKIVVPMLQQQREEVGDQEERFWVTLKGVKKSVFVYEDSEDDGFTRPDRFEGLDMAKCEVALKSLAKFHAMTAVLYSNGNITRDDFDKSIFERSRGSREPPFYSDLLVEYFAESIESAWGPEWLPAANYVRNRLKNMTTQLDQMHKRNEKGFNVLNHGGFMILELLFRNQPLHMRMEGAMNFFYNSPIFDFHKFMCSSPKVDIMLNESQSLLKKYYQELVDYLAKFKYVSSRKLPSWMDIEGEFERTLNFSLLDSISGLQYVLRDPNEKYDLMESVKQSWKNKKTVFNPKLMYGRKYIDTMKKIIKHEMRTRPLKK